ncbi:MAG: WG repeat-containing protein [Bacteroidia bacterium]
MKKAILFLLLLCAVPLFAQVPPGYTKDKNEDNAASPDGEYGAGSGHGYYNGDADIAIPMGDLDRGRRNQEFFIFRENKLSGLKRQKDSMVLLKPVYETINPYNGYYFLHKDKKVGVYNAHTEKIVIPVEHDSVDYDYSLRKEKVLRLKKKGSWGAVNMEGKELLPFKFFKIQYANNNGVALAKKTAQSPVALLFNGKSYKKELAQADVYDNVVIATHNGKKGLFAGSKEVLPFEYDSIYTGSGYNASYAGKNKIKVKRDAFKTFIQNITNLIVIKDKKYGIADAQGNLVVPVQFDNITYDYLRKFYKLKSGKLMGVYFQAEKVTTDIIYDEVSSDGMSLIVIKDKKRGLMDYKGNITIPAEYDQLNDYGNGVYKAVKDKKYGVVSRDGKVLIPLEYDNVDSFAFTFKELFKVEKDGKKGVVNIENKIIIPIAYEFVDDIHKLIEVVTPEPVRKFGLYTPQGEVVAPAEYDQIKRSETEGSPMLFLVKNGKYTMVGKDNKLLYKDEFTGMDFLYDVELLVNPDNNGNAFRIIKDAKGKFGLFEENTGKVTVPPAYDGLYQKLEAGRQTFIVAKKGKKFGVINGLDKEVVLFVYDSINFNRVIQDGADALSMEILARKGKKYGAVSLKNEVKIPFEYEELVRVSYQGLYKAGKKGKYQLLDGNGKVLNPGPFEEITPFEKSNSYVFKDGKMYSMNTTGKIIGAGVPMQPHVGFATFDDMKFALVKALDSKDNALLKAWVDKAAPSEYILKFFKDSDLYKRDGVTMDAAYINQKYYADLLKFKMQDWNGEYYHKKSLTGVKDYTLHSKGIVTNSRTEDWAFGDTRFMEKIFRNAIKINGNWISTYFLARRFE